MVPSNQDLNGRSRSSSLGSASCIFRLCEIIVKSRGTVGWGHRTWVLSKAAIGTVVFFHMLFAQKRETLRVPESEDRDSNALTTKSLRSTTSNYKSSIRILATNLDWLPASKRQRLILPSPVDPITLMRAVCELLNSGEAASVLPTVLGAVSLVGVVTAPSHYIYMYDAPRV